MTRTKWIILIVITGLILGGAILIHHQLVASVHVSSGITDLSETYKADAEIAEATKRLSDGPTPANIINQAKSGHQAAVIFDGLPDRATTARLLDILKKHKAKAIFFVEGQNAANQPETIQMIRKAGMEIGNFTFIGIANAHTLDDATLIEQLCRTQKVVAAMTDRSPTLLRAPKTTYTANFLRVAGACGIGNVVQHTLTLPTVHSEAEVAVFAATVKDGDIIAIPTGIPVEVKVMKQGKSDERPAFDKQPTVKDAAAIKDTYQDTIADRTEWLLASLEKLNYNMDFVN